MKSQNAAILEWLLSGNRLSPLEALSRFNTLRLSGRVFDLRGEKWNIQSELVTRNNKTFSEYWIPADKPKKER
jgi:hypothetical protein